MVINIKRLSNQLFVLKLHVSINALVHIPNYKSNKISYMYIHIIMSMKYQRERSK